MDLRPQAGGELLDVGIILLQQFVVVAGFQYGERLLVHQLFLLQLMEWVNVLAFFVLGTDDERKAGVLWDGYRIGCALLIVLIKV